MLQKPNNKRFGNGASESSLAEREALLAEREATLEKREALLASSREKEGLGPPRFLDKDGNEVNFFEYMQQSPLLGLKFGSRRRS